MIVFIRTAIGPNGIVVQLSKKSRPGPQVKSVLFEVHLFFPSCLRNLYTSLGQTWI